MFELFRDTVVGQLLRLATGNRILQYPEERDPSLWERYLNAEKSANMAVHGSTATPSEQRVQISNGQPPMNKETEILPEDASSSNSDATVENDDALVNTLSGQRIDPEKGRDAHIVDWYGPEDPDNPQNWSNRRRASVTFIICLYTFIVYMASAIYTNSELGVVLEFGVSETKAALGLSLFVLG